MPLLLDSQPESAVHNINNKETRTSVFLLDGPKTSDKGPGLQFEYPPDNGLGVSDGYVVSVENSVIEWTTVAGKQKFETSLTEFMKSLGRLNTVGDSRAIYDVASNRFIVTGAATDSSNKHHYVVAVSKDANPNDGWTYQSFDPPQSTDYPDQPTVATDGSNIYLASLLPTGQQEVLVANGPNNFDGKSPYTRITLGTNNGVYRQNAGVDRGDLIFARQGRTITVKHIDATKRSVDATSIVNLGNSISAVYQEHALPTQGTSREINAGSMQVTGNAYSNGFLYVTFEDIPKTGPNTGVSNTHWAKLDVHDPSHVTLIAQGNISGAQIGNGVGTFNSSVAVNGAGDVLINFTATGLSLAPSDYYVVQYAGAENGSFSKPVQYKASAGSFTDPAGSANVSQITRWGDYSSAVADPANPHAFWISNEYGTSPGTNQWGTATAHVIVTPPVVATHPVVVTPPILMPPIMIPPVVPAPLPKMAFIVSSVAEDHGQLLISGSKPAGGPSIIKKFMDNNYLGAVQEDRPGASFAMHIADVSVGAHNLTLALGGNNSAICGFTKTDGGTITALIPAATTNFALPVLTHS
jgi:hypothetical protein